MSTGGEFYDWERTLSYNADITFVITKRRRGKTFGIRRQCVRDFIKRGYRFVVIGRTKEDLKEIQTDYFKKLQEDIDEFSDYDFKTEAFRGYIAKKVEEGKKQSWDLICYFEPLTKVRRGKEKTFSKVKRIIFDEAIIDKDLDPRGNYLQKEYFALANIVDSCTRETAGSKIRPHLYLMGNACDLFNPYFDFFGINEPPEYGYTWLRNKTVLLHFEEPDDASNYSTNETLAGRMLSGTYAADVSANNKFITADNSMIAEKPKSAKYTFGIVAYGEEIGVWYNYQDAYIYITDKIIEGDGNIVYYLTNRDAKLERRLAYSAEPVMRQLVDMYRKNYIKYSSFATFDKFTNIIKKLGI